MQFQTLILGLFMTSGGRDTRQLLTQMVALHGIRVV
jgi:hypothetical protein